MTGELGPEVTGALGYLVKHAHLHLEALTTRELQPLGLLPRDVGVLRVLGSREPTSQQEIARLLNVDRTTMVTLIDALETRGAVTRSPSADDRRRNVVALTAAGSRLLAKAEAEGARADREFLEPLAARSAQQLRAALRVIVTGA